MNTKDIRIFVAPVLAILMVAATLAHGLFGVSAQSAPVAEPLSATPFRIGEKLTYSMTVGPFKNSGYAEISVVSRGKYRTLDAVELSSRFKSSELVSASLFTVDESRTTFAAADGSRTLMSKRTNLAGVVPISVTRTPVEGEASADWLLFVYKLRFADGTGNFTINDDDSPIAVSSSASSGERVKTDAGDFDVTNFMLQSSYFASKGITDVVVALSNDPVRVPVMIRFKSGKTPVKILLQSVQNAVAAPAPTPRPTVTPTPVPTPTAKPTPTPRPDNLPLSTALPFVLGETLEYRLSAGGKNVGTFVLRARERKMVDKRDTLFLTATATGTEPALGLFSLNDSISAQVDPEGLSPYQFDVKINGALSVLNDSVRFDQDRGIATTPTGAVAVPLNTHSLLSLVYAIRSFNLRPSKDDKNPVNDTRVSVFYDSKYYIFTLRPRDSELINLRGEKVTAQLVTIVTGNQRLDGLALKIWLSTDSRRLPLRIGVGPYQADLVSDSVVAPK